MFTDQVPTHSPRERRPPSRACPTRTKWKDKRPSNQFAIIKSNAIIQIAMKIMEISQLVIHKLRKGVYKHRGRNQRKGKHQS